MDAPTRSSAIRQADRDGCGVTRHALLLLTAAALALRPSVELALAAPMDAASLVRRLRRGQLQPHALRSARPQGPSRRSSGQRIEPSSHRRIHKTP